MAKVTKQHPEYTRRLKQWVRQRDAIEGEDRIKEKGEVYLPRLDGQPTVPNMTNMQGALPQVTSFEAYKARASFMNATGRTRDALVGAIMRKDPDITWPKGTVDQDFLERVGNNLESFSEVANETLDEVVGVGRFGQLVDLPKSVINLKVDPFVASYFAENIIDWDEDLVEGVRRPVMVNLLEKVTVLDERGAEMDQDRHRILKLDIPAPESDAEKEIVEKQGLEAFLALFGLTVVDFEKGPIYFQEVWDELKTNTGSTEKQFVRTALIPIRLPGGALLHEIPFTFYNPESTKPKPQKPTLLDLTVINLSLYKNSADLEHGLHFTALPQPWVAGFKFKAPLYIGSGVAWVSEDPAAHAGYLEFGGQGLGAIREVMAEKKKEMAALGARVLEEQAPSSGAEAAETVRMRHSGEMSVLARISLNISDGLSNTLRFLAMFRGMASADSVGVKLNLDFGTESLDPQMLTALMAQVQAGFMSWNSYFFNVKRGELIPDDITEEDEAVRITAGPPEAPARGMPGQADAGNNPNDPNNPPVDNVPPVDKKATAAA